MRKLEIVIKPNGQTVTTAKGFQGNECLQATANFERRMQSQGTRTMESTTQTSEREIQLQVEQK